VIDDARKSPIWGEAVPLLIAKVKYPNVEPYSFAAESSHVLVPALSGEPVIQPLEEIVRPSGTEPE
jgi:hypothetical protein